MSYLRIPISQSDQEVVGHISFKTWLVWLDGLFWAEAWFFQTFIPKWCSYIDSVAFKICFVLWYSLLVEALRGLCLSKSSPIKWIKHTVKVRKLRAMQYCSFSFLIKFLLVILRYWFLIHYRTHASFCPNAAKNKIWIWKLSDMWETKAMFTHSLVHLIIKRPQLDRTRACLETSYGG